MSFRLKFLMLVMLAVFVVGGAIAHADEDDEFFQNTQAGARDKAAHRSYVGGRDEQNLEIQAILPQPARSPDGSAAPTVGSGDEDREETAPASD